MIVDHAAQSLMNRGETFGEGEGGRRFDDTAGDIGQARAFHLDDAPAGMAEAGINADDSRGLFHGAKLCAMK